MPSSAAALRSTSSTLGGYIGSSLRGSPSEAHTVYPLLCALLPEPGSPQGRFQRLTQCKYPPICMQSLHSLIRGLCAVQVPFQHRMHVWEFCSRAACLRSLYSPSTDGLNADGNVLNGIDGNGLTDDGNERTHDGNGLKDTDGNGLSGTDGGGHRMAAAMALVDTGNSNRNPNPYPNSHSDGFGKSGWQLLGCTMATSQDHENVLPRRLSSWPDPVPNPVPHPQPQPPPFTLNPPSRISLLTSRLHINYSLPLLLPPRRAPPPPPLRLRLMLCRCGSAAAPAILVDLLRTYPHHPFFCAAHAPLIAALHRLLLALAGHLPEVSVRTRTCCMHERSCR